jgi:surface antigen
MNIYPPYGHVAFVEKVFADGRITVREANFVSCRVTSRTRRPAEMRVAGYFKP